MKSWINKSFVMTVLSLVFISCEKEGAEVVVKPLAAPTLASTATSATLLEENEENEALVLNWTPANYGYEAAVNYVLQVDSMGGGFEDPLNIEMGNDFERKFSVEELNSAAIKLGLMPEEEGQLSFRIVSTVSALVDPLISQPVDLTATPYSSFVEPAFIYAPGAYQGWDPGSAASLISVEDDGIYVGYITFPDEESLAFKFTPERDWDMDYGAGSGNALVEKSTDNLMVEELGTYEITVNLNDLSWEAKKHSWGVVGDATGSWDVDQDMTYDSEERVWELTTDLAEGSIKFRKNDDWGVNYGDDDPSDSTLNLGSSNNIPIAEAGTYDIVLNLQDPENPIYSLTKQ